MARLLVATGSVPVREAPDEGADLVTEVIVGERLTVLEERGGWWKVVVPEHGTHLDRLGYPGWIREGCAAVEDRGWEPDLTVASSNSAGLPLGALLERRGRRVLLPGGQRVEIEESALASRSTGCGRSAVEISRALLGLPYRWGGTDSNVGMDCSGMVFRVMGLLGLRVPRDASDQYESAPLKSRDGWQEESPGTLIFSGERSITHVGFYLGGGRYISAHGSGSVVIRGVEEDPYRVMARYR